jgi:hypothetical protein
MKVAFQVLTWDGFCVCVKIQQYISCPYVCIYFFLQVVGILPVTNLASCPVQIWHHWLIPARTWKFCVRVEISIQIKNVTPKGIAHINISWIFWLGITILKLLLLFIENLKNNFLSQRLIFIYLFIFTAIGLTPGCSSTVHIYTQTVHRIQRTEQ